MADQNRGGGLRGDEAELFRAFNAELERQLRWRVKGDDPDVVVEACAFAWAQLVEFQPDRELNWRAWLMRVALREAWRLSRQERVERRGRVRFDSPVVALVESPVDEIEERQDVVDALALLGRLPRRVQRVALLRGFGLSHAQIAELTGDSLQRVDRLLVQASHGVRDALGEFLEASPRARRLQELEREPPAWLVAQIGPIPKATHKAGAEEWRRAWRRAAIALDDYRQAIGPEHYDALGVQRPSRGGAEKLHVRALRTVTDLRAHRERRPRRGIEGR